MNHIALRTLLVFFLIRACVAFAQAPASTPAVTPQENPLTAHSRMLYGGAQMILLRSAEKMPEERYAFKPAETVRSFGQIVGHVADAQYLFCSAALGEKNPAPKVEKSVTSKADLIAALKGAFAYCDGAYNGLTDANASRMVKFMGTEAPKLGVLTVNQVHAIEHYGNLVTYMRMNGIIPPTSDPEVMGQLRK